MPSVGDRVKFSDLAFVNGVAKPGDQRKRGTIVQEAQDHDRWAVRWDGRKTIDRLQKSFVVKEATGQRLSV